MEILRGRCPLIPVLTIGYCSLSIRGEIAALAVVEQTREQTHSHTHTCRHAHTAILTPVWSLLTSTDQFNPVLNETWSTRAEGSGETEPLVPASLKTAAGRSFNELGMCQNLGPVWPQSGAAGPQWHHCESPSGQPPIKSTVHSCGGIQPSERYSGS